MASLLYKYGTELKTMNEIVVGISNKHTQVMIPCGDSVEEKYSTLREWIQPTSSTGDVSARPPFRDTEEGRRCLGTGT
jgi:hypothetical protein